MIPSRRVVARTAFVCMIAVSLQAPSVDYALLEGVLVSIYGSICSIREEPLVGWPTTFCIANVEGFATDIKFGPDGLIYVAEPEKGRILRFAADGGAREVVFSSEVLHPQYLTISTDGRVIFSTRGSDNKCLDATLKGVWVFSISDPPNTLRCLIPSKDILRNSSASRYCLIPGVLYLETGPFEGDMLVTGTKGADIIRMLGPDFTQTVAFTASPPSADTSLRASDMAVTPGGEVLVSSGRGIGILDAEGKDLGILVEQEGVSRFAVNSNGIVFATIHYRQGGSMKWRLAAFRSDGSQLFWIPLSDCFAIAVPSEGISTLSTPAATASEGSANTEISAPDAENLAIGQAMLTNESGVAATLLILTFDGSVMIEGSGSEFATFTIASTSDVETQIEFTGGSVAPGESFYIDWAPDSANLINYEWGQ